MKSNIFKKLGAMLMASAVAVTMIGTSAFAATNPVLPDPDKDGKASISVHKYVKDTGAAWEGQPTNGNSVAVPDTAVPMKNVEFTVEEVTIPANADMTDKTVVANAAPVAGGYKGTIKTDATGTATASNLKFALYRVTEIDNGAAGLSDPCLVMLPMTNPTGNGWIYDIHVYPKSSLAALPTIDKDVTVVGNDNDGSYVGETKLWFLLPDITKDIATAQKYVIADRLKTCFDFVEDSVKVSYVDAKTNTEDFLTKDTDYIFTKIAIAADDKVEGMSDEYLTIITTKAGRAKMANALSNTQTALPKLKIELQLQLTLNSTVPMGEDLYNNACLTYVSTVSQTLTGEAIPGNPQVGEVFTEDYIKAGDAVNPAHPGDGRICVPADLRPEIHTGGVNIWKFEKVGGNAQALKGAQFAIATSEANAKAGNYLKKTVDGVIVDVNKAGYNDATSVVWTATSDAAGNFGFMGLKLGDIGVDDDALVKNVRTDYYIVEIQTPDDSYQLMRAPMKVTVDKDSHTAKAADGQYSYRVENTKVILPVTGGMGTVLFTVIGLVLMGSAIVLFVKARKAKKDAE